MTDQSTQEQVAPEDLRVLLWDIDGTLVRSARTGAFKDYTVPTLEGVFGTAGRLRELTVSGMTDLQIVAEALRDEGFTHEHIRARLGELQERYMTELERAAAAVATDRRYPAAELLPHQPDALLDDLSDTGAVLRTFNEL